MIRPLIVLCFVVSAHATQAFLPEIKPLPADASLELKRREAEWLALDAAHLRMYAGELNDKAAASMVGVPVEIHDPDRLHAIELRDTYKKWASNALKVADAELYRALAYREEIKAIDAAAGNPNNGAASDAIAAEPDGEKPAISNEKAKEVPKSKILKATLADGTVINGEKKSP